MKFKSKIFFAVILIAIIFPLSLIRSTFAHNLDGVTTIHMSENGFEPSKAEIKKGDTVIFENIDSRDRWPASNNHPTHDIYLGFDPQKPIKPGESWEFKLEKEGQWQFHDHLYPQLTGQINVSEQGVSGAKGPNFLSFTWQKIVSAKNSVIKALLSIRIFSKNQSGNEQKAQAVGTLPDQSKIDLDDVYKNLNFTCSSQDYTCIANVLKNITQTHGPQTAISVLEKLFAEGKISKSIDDHQFAHEIGRETAKVFGYNAQSFLACPMSSYNGGCQHGFFENALGKSQNNKEAINLVCGSLDDNFSPKFRFYCYHGVGHGVMMAQAYDLEKSLDVCNSIGTNGTEGCWQGVFMENANAGMRHEAKEGVFSQTDPLAPCNVIEEKYRHECFINHAGPLMNFFKNDLEKATLSCLKAPDKYTSVCLQSIGLMATNPVWQTQLLKSPVQKTLSESAREICLQFPKGNQQQCIIGAVDNIMNFNELQVEEANDFCSIIVFNYQDLCYQKIGTNLRSQTTDPAVVLQKCSEIENINFRKNCLEGASL